jgi:parallel beta-helix repeat protein
LKKILPLFLILILIISIILSGYINFKPASYLVTAESGAPSTNGTTSLPWMIEDSDKIYRSNEDFSTIDIIVNPNGLLEWFNVTCTTVGNITIKDQGELNFINSVLTLEGNLTINGTVTLKNTTLKMNPSQNGEFNIKVEGDNAGLMIMDLDNDPSTLFDRSHVTSTVPDGNHRYMFSVEPNTSFEFKNSQLSECGYNDLVPGLTIKTSQCLIDNSSIFNNYIGLNFEATSANNITKCDIMQNSYAGVRVANLSSSINIINSRFLDNENSVIISSSGANNILDCNFENSGSADIYFINATENKIGSCSSINSKNGLYLTSSSNNNKFNDCLINFTSQDIVKISNSDNNTFTKCKFTDSGSNGVTLTGSAKNVFTQCDIIKNSGWGIYIGNSNGVGNTIKYSTIKDNTGEGIWIESSVSRNLIIHNNIKNNTYGVYYKSTSLNEIHDCNITANTDYGVYYLTGARNLILNTNISENSIGMYLTLMSRFNYINDSAIYNSEYVDIMIEGSSNLTSVNTNFNKINVDIRDSSNLTVKWYLKVKVEDFDTGIPIESAEVKIKDAQHSTYHINYKTGPLGWTGNILTTEYFQTSTSIFTYNPQRVRAWKIGYDAEIQDIYINNSKNIYLNLKKSIIPQLPDLLIINLSFSNNTPVQGQDIRINATVFNNGTENLTAQDVHVGFYLDNITLINSVSLTNLLVQETRDVQTSWVVNTTNGSHILSAEVDIFNFTFELDETNNDLSRQIIINTEANAILRANRSNVKSIELIEFDASDSTDEILGIVQYYFDYGNGNSSGWVNESKVEYGYPASGTFYARVRVRDSAMLISKWSNIIIINVGNRPPIAGFTYTPEIGYVNTDFQFEPNGSVDIDGILTTYEWDFGDGTSSNLVKPTHTFADDITYTVGLMVYDNSGANSTLFNKTLKINNLPPNALFTANKNTVNVNEQIIFDATPTIDLDDNNQTELNYTWDFKDGTFDYGRIVFHSFNGTGEYNVTLSVIDDDLAVSQFFILISVTGEPTSGDDDGDDEDLTGLILIGIGIIVFVIIILLILFLYILPGKRRRLAASTQFVTTGKIDFVILKKKGSKTYRKFELHMMATPALPSPPPPSQTPALPAIPLNGKTREPLDSTGLALGASQPVAKASPLEPDYLPPGQKPATALGKETHMGLYWKTGLIDSSWVIYDIVKGDKESILIIFNNDIDNLMQKNWNLDYAGNGAILQRSTVATPLPSEPA